MIAGSGFASLFEQRCARSGFLKRRSIAVMMCPEKGAPERLYGACGLKDLAGYGRVSEKEFLSGRKRAAAKPRLGTRTTLYMRVSTADQKPDLQDDDLRGYAARWPRRCPGLLRRRRLRP